MKVIPILLLSAIAHAFHIEFVDKLDDPVFELIARSMPVSGATIPSPAPAAQADSIPPLPGEQQTPANARCGQEGIFDNSGAMKSVPTMWAKVCSDDCRRTAGCGSFIFQKGTCLLMSKPASAVRLINKIESRTYLYDVSCQVGLPSAEHPGRT